MAHLKGCCLVQKRHLFGAAFLADLGGSLADEMTQGARQVWLVVIARLRDGVKDRGAMPQEVCSIAGALDLVRRALGKAGGTQEATLDGADGAAAQGAF